MSSAIRQRESWTEQTSSRDRHVSYLTQQAFKAGELSPLANAYTINMGPPKTIVVQNAARLAQLQEVSVSGTLLPRQLVTLDPKTNKRSVALDPTGYVINLGDGDLHLDLGFASLQPHITCELQNARPWLSLFKASLGQPIIVTGFFRCLFEHPGFDARDDAHIFEIHPVRAASIAPKIQPFDVGIPDQQSIHTWTSPHPLNVQDNRIGVVYNSGRDNLTFTGMDGMDENYVRVGGNVSQVQLNSNTGLPASFILDSPSIGHEIRVYSLQATTATRELAKLKASKVDMVALRNIDLPAALKGQYIINLLAIDLQPA